MCALEVGTVHIGGDGERRDAGDRDGFADDFGFENGARTDAICH